MNWNNPESEEEEQAYQEFMHGRMSTQADAEAEYYKDLLKPTKSCKNLSGEKMTTNKPIFEREKIKLIVEKIFWNLDDDDEPTEVIMDLTLDECEKALSSAMEKLKKDLFCFKCMTYHTEKELIKEHALYEGYRWLDMEEELK